MEAEREDHKNVKMFWDRLNECLRKVSGDTSYNFNPVGWCTDMAGENLAGLSEVFGETVTDRIKNCEFHFKDHRNKNAPKLDADSAAEFKTLCNNLLLSATQDAYESSKAEIDAFVAAKEERAFLASWVSWWHARRNFIFRAFAPQGAPRMNQAEVIHAGWAHWDRPNLSMLDVCQADTRDSLLIDIELKNYQSGAAPEGKGPSYADRKRNSHAREVSKAARLGREMFPDEESGHFIDPSSGHCPRENQPKKQKTSKAKQQSSQASNTSIRLTQEDHSNPAPLPTGTISNSTPKEQYGGLFRATPSSSGGHPYPTAPLPSFSSSISPYNPPQQGRSLHQIAQTAQQMQHAGFVHSPVCNSGGYITTSIPSGSSSMIPYGAPQQRLAFHQTAPVAPQHLPGTAVTWHSGMSPHKYEVVVLKPCVKNCYGCGNSFADKYRSSPYNLIVKHVDRRVTGKNDSTGQLIYSRDFSNTYYHLAKSHIQQKNSDFSGTVFISTDLYLSGLDEEQRALLQSCELQLLVQ